MGCPHHINVRAGPHVPPAQRRPGPAPPASVPARLKISVSPAFCRDVTVSPPFPPGAMPSAPSSLLGWTESRCDSVCLRSRHFVAWLRPGLTNDFPPGATLATTARARIQKTSKNPVISLLSPCNNTPRQKPCPRSTASATDSFSPQWGEGPRMRGGYTQRSQFPPFARKTPKIPEITLLSR